MNARMVEKCVPREASLFRDVRSDGVVEGKEAGSVHGDEGVAFMNMSEG